MYAVEWDYPIDWLSSQTRAGFFVPKSVIWRFKLCKNVAALPFAFILVLITYKNVGVDLFYCECEEARKVRKIGPLWVWRGVWSEEKWAIQRDGCRVKKKGALLHSSDEYDTNISREFWMGLNIYMYIANLQALLIWTKAQTVIILKRCT